MNTEKKVIGGIALLTLAILVGGVFLLAKQDEKEQKKISTPLMGEEFPTSAQHVPRGEKHEAYNSNPPNSGPHWGDGVAGPGIKDQPVPAELIIHGMEHGAAVVWYKDDLPASDVERIKTAFNNATGKKIMNPRKYLDVPVALTSWGRLLKLQTIDGNKIKEFIETNNDRAPEKAPI